MSKLKENEEFRLFNENLFNLLSLCFKDEFSDLHVTFDGETVRLHRLSADGYSTMSDQSINRTEFELLLRSFGFTLDSAVISDSKMIIDTDTGKKTLIGFCIPLAVGIRFEARFL